MQKSPSIFKFQKQEIRTILDEKKNPWFLAKDVCSVLDIKNITQAVKVLDEDERSILYIGRQGEANTISESGLYTLIFRSNKKQAKPFRKWVTQEVLPQIRKTGKYEVKEKKPTKPTTPVKKLPLELQELEKIGEKHIEICLGIERILKKLTDVCKHDALRWIVEDSFLRAVKIVL